MIAYLKTFRFVDPQWFTRCNYAALDTALSHKKCSPTPIFDESWAEIDQSVLDVNAHDMAECSAVLINVTRSNCVFPVFVETLSGSNSFIFKYIFSGTFGLVMKMSRQLFST